MLIAAAAMAFTSCLKEEASAPETVSATLTMHAGVEQTKTYLDENNAVLWGKGEAVSLYVGSGSTAEFFDSASTDAYEGQATASFTFNIKDVAEADSYELGGIYPASAATGINNNENPKSFKIALPATQDAEPGKYDPSAYIMVLKPEAVEALPSEYTASFRRAVALNKITLTNVKEDISTVEITVPNTKYLAGRRSFDLTTGESGDVYENGGRTNTIKVNSAYPAGTIDVWFTSWGVELAAGQELTVKMISPSKIYTRTITAIEGGIKFVEGDLNKLTVNMASATEEVNTDLSGDYLIASVPESWNLMSGTNGGEYYSRIVSGVTTSATDVKCADFYSVAGVNDCIWTVEKMGDNYSIKNKTTGKYVSYSGSENHAYTSDTAVEFALSENDGVMTVESKAVVGRKLKYNSSSPRFAFYTTDQTPLYFIPWEADTTPRINVEKNSYEVEATEGSIDIMYTTNDVITGPITASVKNGTTMTINSTSVADGKVTVNYAANTLQQTKTATIVLSYDGAESQEVVITQAAAGATKQYYVKVTSAPTDWSGTYLIVAGTSVATVIEGSWMKYVTTTINDNEIEATATINAYAVTVAKVTSQSYYTIKLANGQYLGTPSSNGIKQSATVGDDFYWKFSISSDLVKIEANAYSGRILRLNGTSGFRTYTSTTGTQATLYRLEGGETPEEPGQPTLSSRDLAFSSATATATVGEAFTAPTLSGVTDGVTYTSSNTSVATVNASTGAVTLVGAGTTTITATAPETGEYEADEASYTLTVSAAQGGGSTDGYTLITDLSQITSGTYVIAAKVNNKYYAMSKTFTSKINGVAVTVSNNTIAESAATDYVVTITKSGSSYTIKSGTNYLKYVSSTNLGTQTSAYNWTIAKGTKGTFRFTSENSSRGLVFRAGAYNQFGGYALTNVTASGTEYYDVELFKLN